MRARANRQELTADFQAYLDGFSPNVQDILDNFGCRNQIPRLSRADALGTLIEKLTSPDINLSPARCTTPTAWSSIPVSTTTAWAGSSRNWCAALTRRTTRRQGALDPARCGATGGEAVFLPIADQISSGTYLLYDGAYGTGGMLTVAEESLRQLVAEHGKEVATHLYGRDLRDLEG